MKHGDSIAERGAKPINGLRRQRDFRNEDDGGLTTLIHDAPQQLDVDESLSAAGDPVQQKDGALFGVRHFVNRALLRGRRLESCRRDAAALRKRIPLHLLLFDYNQASLLQRLEHCRGEFQLYAQVFN